MRIAVTYNNGEVFQHFGHSEYFKVYEVEDGKVVSSEVVGSDGQGHGALAGLLAGKGIDVLICGGIGGGGRRETRAGCRGVDEQVIGIDRSCVCHIDTRKTRETALVGFNANCNIIEANVRRIHLIHIIARLGSHDRNRDGITIAHQIAQNIGKQNRAILPNGVFILTAVIGIGARGIDRTLASKTNHYGIALGILLTLPIADEKVRLHTIATALDRCQTVFADREEECSSIMLGNVVYRSLDCRRIVGNAITDGSKIAHVIYTIYSLGFGWSTIRAEAKCREEEE